MVSLDLALPQRGRRGGTGAAIATLVERATRYVLLVHLPGAHDAPSVAAALTTTIQTLPAHLRRSLTWDRGTELARHADITLATDMAIYFCDPHSPWQRGSNENIVSLGWAPEGVSGRLVSAATGDSREYWPPLRCVFRLTCPWSS